MTYFLVKKSNNYLNIVWIVVIIIFTILSFITMYKNKELFDNKKYKLGLCSKNCCSTQWNTPINVRENSKVDLKDVGKKYATSNLTCNNGIINTGCVCLDKKSKKMLSNRGYIKDLPKGTGLLDSDNAISAFKIMETSKRNVMKQSNELTGKKGNIIGSNEIKYEKKLQSYSNISGANDISKYFSLPVNNNEIQWDTKVDGISTETEEMLKYQIGRRDKDINVNRK